MKYYSDVLNKIYDTEEELVEAEKAFEREKKDREAAKEAGEAAISVAKEVLDKVAKEYELAKDKAAEILDTSNKEVEKIMKDAEDAYKKAEEAYFRALWDQKKKFGTYKAKEKAISTCKTFSELSKLMEEITKYL